MEAANGTQGLQIVTQHVPALVLLDLGLPDMEGAEIIRQVREWSSIPIVVLSARGEEESKVAALDAGADDYLTKPFGVGELLARIRVAMRHASRINSAMPETSLAEFGDVRVDLEARVVTRNGKDVKMTKIEFDLLAVLARNIGKVVTHRQLLKEVWGVNRAGDSHYLRIFIRKLRRKIETDPTKPRILLTELGVGYRLAQDADIATGTR